MWPQNCVEQKVRDLPNHYNVKVVNQFKIAAESGLQDPKIIALQNLLLIRSKYIWISWQQELSHIHTYISHLHNLHHFIFILLVLNMKLSRFTKSSAVQHLLLISLTFKLLHHAVSQTGLAEWSLSRKDCWVVAGVTAEQLLTWVVAQQFFSSSCSADFLLNDHSAVISLSNFWSQWLLSNCWLE